LRAGVPKALRFVKVESMENAQKMTKEEFLKTPDAQFFMDRLVEILMMQMEREALEKAGSNGDETRK